ncbi:MAG: hypothetical protein HYV09_06665 [Deltaproteobacteria bacterium]|nr:hypothetical protein [Deltaproteobacteria bacterium]
MLTLRAHHERLLAGLQPVAGSSRAHQGWSKADASSQGYSPAAGASVDDRTPAIGFPMNPEVGR